MRQVLLCCAVLAGIACIGIAPAKAAAHMKDGWSTPARLVEKAGWRRYYRRHGYYPPPYIFYPPPYPYMSPRYGYGLPYHYRYYPPY
jgi:hypothetical protein